VEPIKEVFKGMATGAFEGLLLGSGLWRPLIAVDAATTW
jgi:hypothetical protein